MRWPPVRRFKGLNSCRGDQLYQDLSRPRSIKFAEKNGLPDAKDKSPLLHKYCLRRAEKGRFDVGVGIPLSVPVTAGSRHKSGYGRQYVCRHIGIGIFIDRDCGRRMGNKNMAKPAFHVILFYNGHNSGSNIDQLSSRRYLYRKLSHGKTSLLALIMCATVPLSGVYVKALFLRNFFLE